MAAIHRLAGCLTSTSEPFLYGMHSMDHTVKIKLIVAALWVRQKLGKAILYF